MKKRVYLKKWFEKVLSVIACVSFMFIATTIDSDWNGLYLKLLIINFIAFVISSYLLINYSRDIVKENEKLFNE